MNGPDTTPAEVRAAERQRNAMLGLWRDVLIIGTLAISGLIWGAGFLMPLVLAVLVFVLILSVSDTITTLRVAGRPLPVWFGNLLGVLVVLAALLSITGIMVNQTSSLIRELPGYAERFDQIVDRMGRVLGEDLADSLQAIVLDIDTSQFALTAAGGAGAVLSGFFLICLYAGFMMAERQSFADKIQLAAPDPETGEHIAQLLHAISHSLQRYISIKTFVSVLTAGISYPIFKLIDLDFAETWGVLTFALNFIPTIGSFVAVLLPALMALVQFDTFGPFLIVITGCGVVQFIVGNILDPTLLGRSLNMSPFMVVLSLMFWTAVWGITGAFLSVPLTVCILIVFSHIPAMQPIVLLISQRGLMTVERALGQDIDPEIEAQLEDEVVPDADPAPDPAA